MTMSSKATTAGSKSKTISNQTTVSSSERSKKASRSQTRSKTESSSESSEDESEKTKKGVAVKKKAGPTNKTNKNKVRQK